MKYYYNDNSLREEHEDLIALSKAAFLLCVAIVTTIILLVA